MRFTMSWPVPGAVSPLLHSARRHAASLLAALSLCLTASPLSARLSADVRPTADRPVSELAADDLAADPSDPADQQTRDDGTPEQVRVSAAKTELRSRCSATGKVIGTLQRGDRLEVIRVVDSSWYRVRLPGSNGAEGCVSTRAVMAIPGATGDSVPTTRAPRKDAPGKDAPGSDRDRPGRDTPVTKAPADRDPMPPPETGSQRQRPRSSPSSRPSAAPRDGIGVDAFVHFGTMSFTASESFEAILDKSSGPVFGGGGQVNLPFNLFARVDVSRFRQDGERVFVSNGEVFKLGIPTTITLTPIEFTGGYRRELRLGQGAGSGGFRLIPFGGAGVGSVKYQEEADFANPEDDTDERFTSYHVLGGVDVPLWRWIGVGAEYQHRWVPDALGTGGVSAEFDETDLGGGTFRVRIVVSF